MNDPRDPAADAAETHANPRRQGHATIGQPGHTPDNWSADGGTVNGRRSGDGGVAETAEVQVARPRDGRAGNPHTRNVGTRIREAVPAALLTLLLAVAVVPVVEAVNWNSEAAPLRVTGYGSIGDGYGNLSVSTGSSGTRFVCSPGSG